MSRALQARAFTHGRDIYFRQGEFRPATEDGRHLLAHEIAHVLQQRAGESAGAQTRRALGASRNSLSNRAADGFGLRSPGKTPPVVQRSPAPEMLAGDRVTAPEGAPAAEGLRLRLAAGCHRFLLTAAGSENPWEDTTFARELADAAVARLPEATDSDADDLQAPAQEVAALRDQLVSTGESMGIAEVLRRLTRLRETGSATVSLLAFMMSRHLGRLLVRALPSSPDRPGAGDALEDPSGLEPMDLLGDELSRALVALDDPIEAMRLELEGTLNLLIDRRRTFAAAQDRSERARLGDEIGTFARQALMLNESLQRLENRDPSGDVSATPLDRTMESVQGEIDAIARDAPYEGESMRRLGDPLSLLTVQRSALFEPQYPERLDDFSGPMSSVTEAGTFVRPEEAFPIGTDTAMDEMMGSLAERIDTQRTDLARLRAAVLPPSPSYSLDEFAQVFRRWDAFFSVEQENQDPILRLWMDMLGEPYRLLGSAALGAHPMLGALSSAEGALARHLLLRQAVTQLDQWSPLMSSLKPGTGRAITRPIHSREQTSGSSLEAVYRFGQLYPEAGSLDTAGEQRSRARRSEQQRTVTAASFSQVAAMPPDLQGPMAIGAGLAPDASVPLVGLRRVESREGWSFLVDVVDPMATLAQGADVVVAREHKVIPTEVVDYLLAAQQHRATLAHRHQPQAGGRPLGDAGARRGGLEASQAVSQATYLEGETNPGSSDEARNLAEVRDSALGQMRGWGMRIEDAPAGGRPPALGALDSLDRYARGSDPTLALIPSLEGYLNDYFRQETMTHTEHRVATVLVIASIQFGAAQQAREIVDPARLAEVIQEAFKISGITALLSSFGPLGGLLGQAFSTYMSANGVSNLAAIQSLVSFLVVAAEADSLSKARVRARLVPILLGDLQELVDSVVSEPVSHAVQSLAHGIQNPPRTPRELADFCRPMMEDPATRQVLLDGVQARIRELELTGHDPLQPSVEYRSLRALHEQLAGHARGESVLGGPDADLPLARDRRPNEDLGRVLSRRSDVERTALRDALGEYRGLPLIENPDLGNAVRVHYLDGELRVEVGPEAMPRHVEAHQATIRQLKRYSGFVGRLRRLRDRVLSIVRLRQAPAFGTAGNEARMEVEKLQRMIWDLENLERQVDTRASRLSSDEALAAHRAEQSAITREIEGLQQQLAHFETLVDSVEAGRGFVASGDTTGRAAETRLREAEAATRTQEGATDRARSELRSRQEAQRTAEVPRQQTRDRLAEAQQYYDAFRDDPDPKVQEQITEDLERARGAAREAETQLRQAREATRLQRELLAAQESRLHELRSAEVDVAREHLEGQLSDLYRERRTALAALRDARAERQRLLPQLDRAQAELQRALQTERRRPPPDLRDLSGDQARAVYQAAEDAKAERLRPLREEAGRLQREVDSAAQRQREAEQQHAQATQVIDQHVLDFERRQAAAVGVTAERYDYLRARTPDSARQSAAQRVQTDAIYGTPIQGTPQADHIVSMFEIVRMPGFNRLSPDQQVEILNDPANFWSLDSRVNASKGHRSLRVWRGHPDAAAFPPIPDADYQRLVTQEDSARQRIRNRIATLVGDADAAPNAASPAPSSHGSP